MLWYYVFCTLNDATYPEKSIKSTGFKHFKLVHFDSSISVCLQTIMRLFKTTSYTYKKYYHILFPFNHLYHWLMSVCHKKSSACEIPRVQSSKVKAFV